MITTVLFDLDGLLIDSEVVYYRMADELAQTCGGSLTLEEYVRGYCGRTLDVNMQGYIDTFGIPMTVEEAMQWTWNREAEITQDGIPLKPGAMELIQYLRAKNIRMILATSSLADRAERILKADGVYDYFDDFVCGAEVQNSKPHPETFLLAAEKAGEIPANCLVLEDSENGVRAAHAGGFPVICVPDLKTPPPEVQAMAVAVVKSLYDVIPLIG